MINVRSGLSGKEKAAIILISLGPELSGQVLKHLREDQIEELTLEIAGLRRVEPDVADAVLREFHQLCLAKEYLSLIHILKRHQAIANNIANIDTPGYKRQDVAFPEVLAQAVKSEGSKLTLRRTNPRHLPPPPTGSLSVTVERGTSLRNDGNNVDAEVETAELAKNAMYYDSLIDRAGGYLRSLRLVISEGRR